MGPIHLTSRPTLREPILIAAFRGWNDGGTAATIAAAFLKNHLHAERFGEIDSDGFVDYQQTRPQVTIEEGHVRQITWPETEFFHARLPNGERDILLVIGVEPNFRWREFSRSIAQLAQELGCTLAVTLGGLGTISGAIFGSLVVGLFIQLTTLIIPTELKNVGALLVLIVILLVRPYGLLGRRERVG